MNYKLANREIKVIAQVMVASSISSFLSDDASMYPLLHSAQIVK